MAPILGYWNCRGRGYPIRLILAYTQTDFVDKIYNIGPAPGYDISDWLKDKSNPNLGLDFPNLPYYIDGDVKLSQSLAILRYIARKNKLDGQNEEQKIRIDLVEQQLTDVYLSLIQVSYKPDFTAVTADDIPKYEASKVEYLKNLPQKLQELSKFLGDRPFLAGDNVTYVDFLAYELFEKMREFAPGQVEAFDNLAKFVSRIESLPQIEKYLKSTPKIPFNAPIAFWGNK